MNRKGSLSISTNAIVVLIIAVIMLGLIIGLVTTAFESVEKQFLSQINDQEPEAPTPSLSNPVTLSSSTKLAAPGDLVGFKVKILNTKATALNSAEPKVECTTATAVDASTDQSFTKPIAPSEIESFTYLFKIPDTATANDYLCRIVVHESASLDSAIKAAEFTLKIGE